MIMNRHDYISKLRESHFTVNSVMYESVHVQSVTVIVSGQLDDFLATAILKQHNSYHICLATQGT